MNNTSEEYRLATEISMFLADKLNEHGIKTVVVTEEKAKEALERERTLAGQGQSGAEFSMRDIMNLSYTWNGEEVSMRGFAEQFMSEIKQKDRTIEDAERIAKAFIEAVKADPEKAGMKMLKAENMANAFRFKLPDGTIYTPEHPMAASPEYETQKGLWEIYEYVLGKETMREFIGLLSKNAPMSSEERRRYSELESRVNGSNIMQQSLEIPASKVNENRVKDIRNLIQYFEGNDDYTWTEKALIVKGAMSFGYSEKKEADSTRVEIKNISDNNSVSVPVIGGEAAAVVEGLRKGLNFKDALVQARIMLSKESKRSVGGNFTGWKVYKQSDKEEDAVVLNQDVAGTGWCTGGAVSTARSHLSGGDFHVYYEAGEPLIAIRTENGRMAEPPRGAHDGQFCTDREEQIAFDYIRSGNGIIAGDDYIADIEDIRHIMSPDATALDAFLMPEKRRYENGEFGGDTSAWGDSVEQRIAELIPDKKEERWKLGLYYGYEIEDACKNGNAIAIKGTIELTGSSSLTLPEGVTQVGNIVLRGPASLNLPKGLAQVGCIYLRHSASLTLPEGVTQVGEIALTDSTSLILSEGVTQVGDIGLTNSASLTLPEGVTQVGTISLYDSISLILPDGVTQVGDIHLGDFASLTLPKGVKKVGDIVLSDSTSLTLPEGVTQVGHIILFDSTSLTLPEGVMQVGAISLYDSTSLTLPEGVTKVEKIHLERSSSLILPKGVMRVGDIDLRDFASLTLSEGVTQVGRLELSGSSSLTLPESITQVGDIVLHGSSSLILPKGVTQVGEITLTGSSSLILPEGVTQVGEITLIDSSSLTLPESVTRVGNIYLRDSASFTLPDGVTKMGNISLLGSASFTLPEGVTQVGTISLYDSASLTLPEGVTQVGSATITSGASITFPDGFVLSTSKTYSAEEINQLLSEHQKKQEFRLANGTIYGYQQGDTIYLTPAGINPNTPIHEYAHLWAKVYEKLHPAEWESLKEELKTLSQWQEIAESESYSFIESDENRLAGEVLATIIGNRGEEIMLSTAKESLKEGGRIEESVAKGAEYFRRKVTDMAVKDVFDADGMERTGEVTLKVLQDFAKGKGLKITREEREKLAAMAEFDRARVKASEYNWQYYGVFLDDKSKSIIDREFRNLIPSNWKKYADHITVQYNDYSQDAISKGRALSSKLGYEYSAQIVAVGKTDTAIALKVDGIETANKIAHITLAVSPEGKPVDSNKITEWNPVGPIEINGALGLSYKGKKYFHVLDDNEVVDFQIGKHSLNQQETNMNNINLSDLDRHGIEHFQFEHIMPSRVLRGTNDHGVPIHASSKMCDDAGIIGNYNRMGIPVVAIKGKESLSVPPGGVYLVEEGKSNYKLLSKEAFDKRFTMVEVLRENGENTLVCVRAGTKLNFAQTGAKSVNMDKPNLNSIDILSIDSKTLRKAALFVAWELREDNPYEFIVNLSRAELEDFVKNLFNKLNDEDRDIVSKILSHEPGYGEDYVEKQISFRPDIETLLVDDLTVGGDVLDKSFFYLATKDMNDAQLQQLRDNVRKKAVDFYSNMDKKNDLPGHKDAEKFVDKQLHSWFRPWTHLAGKLEHQLDEIHMSDSGPVSLKVIEATARDAMADPAYANYINRELKGWIRNRCADYGLDYTKLPEDLQYEGAAETYRQMFPEYVKDTKIDTLTRDAILAHIDKITALYPQYPQDPTKVSLKPDGTIVRQYGEFEYEQIKGGFERSKNLVLVEELDGEPLQRKALYSMSSDSYGEHPNGPYVRFWDNGNIRSYENCSVRVGSDNEFESDMLSFTREGIVQEIIPGDYPIEPFLEDITNEYMKTMVQREGLEPNATADKLATMAGLSPKELRRENLRRKAEKSFNRQIGTLGSSSNNNLLNNGQKRR